MLNRVQTQTQQPLHGIKLGGLDKKNPTDVKATTVAKAVIAALAVVAAVSFSFIAVVTANPLFLIGSCVAVGILLGLGGVHLHLTAGYRKSGFIDPTFNPPYRRRTILPNQRIETRNGGVPARGNTPVITVRDAGAFHQPVGRSRKQAPQDNFNPIRDHGNQTRNVGVPARGNTPVIPVRDAGAVHVSLGGRR